MRVMKGLKLTVIAAVATLASVGARADSVSMPSDEDLARFASAYAAIKAMSPKWGVQDPESFKTSSDAGVPVLYLDVRTEEEHAKGYVAGATLVSLTKLATAEGMSMLPADKTTIIAVYCKSGHRSAMALPLLHQLGYTNAINMKGGWLAWTEAGYPVEGVTE